LHKQAKKAVAEIEKNAVLVGKKHLNEVCPQIIKETQRYIKFTVLGDQTPEDFLLRHDQTSHAILSGPDMKNLFLALQEIDRDREALERAAGTLNSTRGSGVSHAGDDFEKAAMVLDRTRSVLADEFPILHRIWDKAYLTPDVYFDENKKHPKYRTKEGADAVWKLRSLIFHTLKDSYRANLSLQKTLDQKSIWDLSPLIDTTLEEMKHSDLTIHYRAAQERLEEQEKMSIAATLALVTSVLEAAGSVLSAEPPILLGLAATSAVLSVIDNVYEFLKLRTSDQAYLASLDPRLSLSTEPSYLGFYVSVAFSMLDIKGVKDAVRKLSLARYGDDFTQLASDLAKAG